MTVRVDVALDVPEGLDGFAAALGRDRTPPGAVVTGVRRDGDLVRFTLELDAVGEVPCVARPGRGGGRVQVRARGGAHLPYFEWAMRPVWWIAVRGWLRRTAAGTTSRRRPWWAPPANITPGQASLLATICATFTLTAYCGSLFTQTGAFVADTYAASNPALTASLALTRVGTLVALLGTVVADRRGRRVVLLASVAGVCAATLVSAAMPGLVAFTVAQVLVRGLVNLAATVALVVLVEESPEGTRAYVLALSTLAGGLGFAVGAVLLPVADLAPQAWRVLFLLGGGGLALVPGMARRVTEGARYTAVAASGRRRGRVRDVLHPTYGPRFALLVVTAFFTSVFVATSSQLMNPFLQDERGFSAAAILVLRAVTQGPLTLVAVLAGGRLAETRGRRPVVVVSSAVASVAIAGFYLTAGVPMWALLLVGTLVGALGAPAWGTMSGELFPTAVRGTANGWLLVSGVLGSMSGLAAAGPLSVRLGSLGAAVAVLAVPAVVVAVLLVPFLPEGAGRDLDELSPPEG